MDMLVQKLNSLPQPGLETNVALTTCLWCRRQQTSFNLKHETSFNLKHEQDVTFPPSPSDNM